MSASKFDQLYGHERLLQSQRDAAPELYEALDGLAAAYRAICDKHHEDFHLQGGSWHAHAVAALAKARGEA